MQLDSAVNDFLEFARYLSQDKFVFSKAKHTMMLGAWGSGKTRALIDRAIWPTLIYPGNEGMIGRAFGPELESTTMKQFFEHCPKELIDNFRQKERRLTMRTVGRKKSDIVFSHIIDPSPTKSHIASANWGWFCVDQAEDIEAFHWDQMQGRLRRPDCGYNMGSGVANPKGHDWIYYRFMLPVLQRQMVDEIQVPGKFNKPAKVKLYQASKDHLLIQTQSAENLSLGDDYLKNLMDNMPPEWVQRYVYGSTDQWEGQIYKEFSPSSVHVIAPVEIPKEWPCIVSMDAGGVDPWGITVLRLDPAGDVIQTNEYYQATTLLGDIAAWCKNPAYSGIPDWKNASYFQDPENAQTIYEFNQDPHNLPVQAAGRGGSTKKPGIYRIAGYMHRRQNREKTWHKQGHLHELAEDHGTITIHEAPYFWIFNTCPNTIHDLAEYHWDYDPRTHTSKEEPVKRGFHLADALRYGFQAVPPIEEVVKSDMDYQNKLNKLREHDFYSYQAAIARSQERAYAAKGKPGGREITLDEAWADEVSDEYYRQRESGELVW